MPLITVVLVLVVVGFVLWLVNKKIPMEATIKTIVNVLVVVVVCVWLLSALGLLGSLEAVRVGPPVRR